MKKVLEIEEFKLKGKEISKIVMTILQDTSKLPTLVSSQEEELQLMTEAADFLGKEFNCKVEVMIAEESTQVKAKSAMPGKVGILVE